MSSQRHPLTLTLQPSRDTLKAVEACLGSFRRTAHLLVTQLEARSCLAECCGRVRCRFWRKAIDKKAGFQNSLSVCSGQIFRLWTLPWPS